MSSLRARFEAFIAARDFPCVGAKAARARKTITVLEADDILSDDCDGPVYEGLQSFGEKLDHEAAFVQSCAVVFHGPSDLDEVAFVRFASVYREFKDITEFMQELKSMLGKTSADRGGASSRKAAAKKKTKKASNRGKKG